MRNGLVVAPYDPRLAVMFEQARSAERVIAQALAAGYPPDLR
jgi:hypothetical protein